MNSTIESKAAGTILDKPLVVQIGRKVYNVAHPSLATLIMASKVISELKIDLPDKDNVMYDSLRIARNCQPIGKIIAILIRGAKAIENDRRKRLFSFWRFFRQSPLKKLANHILLTLSPEEAQNLLAGLLGKMEIPDFFALTTFLGEINLLRPKKVDN